jgi:hypothetical protein
LLPTGFIVFGLAYSARPPFPILLDVHPEVSKGSAQIALPAEPLCIRIAPVLHHQHPTMQQHVVRLIRANHQGCIPVHRAVCVVDHLRSLQGTI